MTIYKRFNIDIDIKTVRSRFINRLFESIFNGTLDEEEIESEVKYNLLRSVSYAIGERYSVNVPFSRVVGNDFYTNLVAVEAVYNLSSSFTGGDVIQKKIENSIRNAINYCEIDISIGWESGKFYRKGAEELDQFLINQPLDWIDNQVYISVKQPFEKALKLFLESQKRQDLLSDVIVNAYESIEALAKIITLRNKDLSANADVFIKTLKLSNHYKPMFKEFLKYANHYRHGLISKKELPKVQEVESFLYMTGLFIRLSITVPIEKQNRSETA